MQKLFRGFLICLILLAISCANISSAALPSLPKFDAQELFDYACQKVRVLALSRREFDNLSNKEGEQFSAKLVEDVLLDKKVIIPSGSVINGEISKIKLPKQYPCRDGEIHLVINKIETKDKQIINVEKGKVTGIVLHPYAKTLVEKAVTKAPITATYQAISIPLSITTDISTPVTFGIATGAAATVGALSGYIKPDKDKTRTETAKFRAIGATPIGTVRYFVNKGKKAKLKKGDGLFISFDVKFLKSISLNKSIK